MVLLFLWAWVFGFLKKEVKNVFKEENICYNGCGISETKERKEIMTYIKEFQDGQRIIGHYLCKEKSMFRTKAGKNYLSLILQDKTGTVPAKVWELNVQIGEFDKGDFIKIDAQVTTFQGDIQLNVQRLRRSMEGEYDPKDYMPCTEKDIPAMFQEIQHWIDSLRDPHLKKLLCHFYREDPELMARIQAHPAAKSVHHNFVGGYLEHVTSVTRLAEYLAGQYRPVRRDLVVAAALLHDIGKLWEINPMPAGDYSTAGQLLGHIMIGYEEICKVISQIPGFPTKLAVELEHIILAHHGELEFGSPKVPMTMEAMIIHIADNADAKLKMIEEFIKNDNSNGEWTEYNRFLSRPFYKGGREEEETCESESHRP